MYNWLDMLDAQKMAKGGRAAVQKSSEPPTVQEVVRLIRYGLDGVSQYV